MIDISHLDNDDAIRIWRMPFDQPPPGPCHFADFLGGGVGPKHRATAPWWLIATPEASPLHPDALPSPELARVVCDGCLTMAMHIVGAEWDEANMPCPKCRSGACLSG